MWISFWSLCYKNTIKKRNVQFISMNDCPSFSTDHTTESALCVFVFNHIGIKDQVTHIPCSELQVTSIFSQIMHQNIQCRKFNSACMKCFWWMNNYYNYNQQMTMATTLPWSKCVKCLPLGKILTECLQKNPHTWSFTDKNSEHYSRMLGMWLWYYRICYTAAKCAWILEEPVSEAAVIQVMMILLKAHFEEGHTMIFFHM
jgi:hypothetical protein